MKILLIDADSLIPNLALMKISQYHKLQNDNIRLIKLNIPYFPYKKKEKIFINTNNFDKVYCSCIFDNSYKYVVGKDIIFGGVGYPKDENLPIEIEKLKPDYSLYSDNEFSYGFISRGCIRKCKFCKVPKKEGYIHQVNNVNDIVEHKKVKFLDNNFLALPNHKNILNELIEKNIKCQFNQGLDIRLIDEENSVLLSKLNYLGEYLFAFDDIKLLDLIKEKLNILSWRKKWQLKFYTYINANMKFEDFIKRIEFLKENACLSYAMRDINCYTSTNKNFYTDISNWCNAVNMFKKKTFREFCNFLYKDNRVQKYREITNIRNYYNNGGLL